MENNEKKAGFFCRKVFMEQMKLLKTPAQFLELFRAAYAYVDEEDFNITDDVVKMAFSSWKLAFDYDKKKDEEYHRERKRISTKANEAKKKKREAKGNTLQNSPSDETAEEEPPLIDVEEVEKYPFEEFWNAYNYIKNKKGTSEIWRMMPDEDKKAAIEAVPKYLKWYENEKKRSPKLTKLYPKTFLLDRRFMDDFTIEEVTQTNTNNYGSNNGQRDGRTQQQINIERNAQAVAKLFSEIRPMQPDGSDY